MMGGGGPKPSSRVVSGVYMYVLRYGRGYVKALRYEDGVLSVIYSVAIEEITGVPCVVERC